MHLKMKVDKSFAFIAQGLAIVYDVLTTNWTIVRIGIGSIVYIILIDVLVGYLQLISVD